MNLMSLFLTTWLIYNPVLIDDPKHKKIYMDIALKNVALMGGLLFMLVESKKYTKPTVKSVV